MIEKSDEAYRTIGEVAERLDLPPHVLRFWETRFKEIDPVKRAGGRRYYRPRDVELVSAIRHLLYGEGYTIKGVQRLLKEQGARAVIDGVRSGGAPRPAPEPAEDEADAPPTRPAFAQQPAFVQEPVFAQETVFVQETDFTPPRTETELRAEAPRPPGSEPEAEIEPPLPPRANLPAVIPRAISGANDALDIEDAQRLRAALAELAECRRLLLLTKR